MDILIKNMEMPKSCYSDEFVYCPFLFFDYDTKSQRDRAEAYTEVEASTEGEESK